MGFLPANIHFFENPNQFRDWLSLNSFVTHELWVGYYKKETGIPSLTWSESVDQALCFGWIDGIRKSIDIQRFCIRYTPRKPNSNWSQVNIDKMENLISNGLMTPKGLILYQNRKVESNNRYSYENMPKQLPPDMEQLFKEDPRAWDFFLKQAPSYKKTTFYWILSAKQESTKLSRLLKTIEASIQNQRVL